ncbi:MAG: HlyD family efflux transporter periplasmic adaptor subunit [Desulfococcaceae bacterium]|jgi:RND family efflux transporter MFP subunit|nr:HlyD family efflux transporter periplasmic adaptor subunit [Desulfococcaceae bacterium]
MKKIFVFVFLCPVFAVYANAEGLFVRSAKETIRLSGYTRSNTVITLSSEVSGRVLQVNYDVGQQIGDKAFYEIDPTFIDFQIQNIRHSVRKMKNALLKNASAVDYLEKEFRRIDQLHKGDRATEVKRDAAKEELTQARLERKSLKVENAILLTALKEAEEKKRRHSIFAPKDWIVIRKIVEAGELVTVNTPMAKLGDFRQLVVPLSVSGKELQAIRKLPELFAARLEDRSVKARLNWVNPEFDEKTRKLGMELLLPEYDGEKRGGLRFALDMDVETEGLLIPGEAVINRYENPRVRLKESGETVSILILGESGGDMIAAENPKLKIGTELQKPE